MSVGALADLKASILTLFYAAMVLLVLVAGLTAVLLARGRYRPARFITTLAVGIFFWATLAVLAVLVMQGGRIPIPTLARVLLQSVAVIGLSLFAILLPFLLLMAFNRYWQLRYTGLLGLQA
ncbi:MAG: hypothetical protein QHH07_07445 [Sedimentisphaerales bacterium]|nr:hypothetical protein [Sedimentisphaerales bacterium]